MTEQAYYLAYGSNLHPLRLQERIDSAQLIGTVTLTHFRLLFHKRGADRSGKCNLLPGQNEDRVHAALYAMNGQDIPLLDRFEGEGYERRELVVVCDGYEYDCFYYSALASHIDAELLPHDWYKELVMLGAKYHAFPGEYCAMIDEVASQGDPDPQRLHQHLELLERLKQ